MEEYIHHDKEKDFLPVGKGTVTIDEKSIPYEGRMLIAVQRYDGKNRVYFAVVPGFVVDFRFKHTEDKKGIVSKVEPVGKSKQKDITARLRQDGFEGEVNFW